MNRIRAFHGAIWFLAVVALSLAAHSASGAPAPAAPGTPPAPSQDAVLRIATFGGIPLHLSPFDYQGRLQGDIENIYEPLVYPHLGTWEIKGVLAENWTVSPDGKVYRFNLRRGVTFHDGTPLTANAVKVSFEYFRKTGKSAGEPVLRNVQEVRVVDDNTVEFVIEPIGLPFLIRLTGFLVASPKAVEAQGSNPDWFARNAVGTGPYVLEEYKTGDRLVLKRNDRWWGSRPYFAKVVYLTVPELSTQALMMERGDLDIAYNLPPESLRKFEESKNLKVIRVNGDRVMNVRLNVSYGPLTNLKLRQALAYAVDYATVLKARELEIAPSDGPIPFRYMGGWIPKNLIGKQDLEKAKKLLVEAGHKPGDLKLDMYIPVGASLQITMGEVLQASFAKIGVKLNVVQTEWNPMFNRLQRFARDKNPADAVDIFTMVRGPFVPHQYAYFNSFEKGQPNNFMAYENKTVQELFDRGYILPKEAEAMRLYTQGVTRIVADQPDLWPYTEKRVVVLRREIEGYYMHPTWFPETHVWTIYKK